MRRDRIAAIDFLDQQIREVRTSFDTDRRGLHLDGYRDRILVVFDQKQHRQLQIAGAVSALPTFAFTRRAVARGAVDDFVAMDRCPSGRCGHNGARLRHTRRLQELRSGGARLADDVQLLVTPVGRHLRPPEFGSSAAPTPASAFRRRHAERQTERRSR